MNDDNLLSATAGYVDTLSFFSLFGLFTAHVTGNFVLIGGGVAGYGQGVFLKLMAFPAFILGVALSSFIIRGRNSETPMRGACALDGCAAGTRGIDGALMEWGIRLAGDFTPPRLEEQYSTGREARGMKFAAGIGIAVAGLALGFGEDTRAESEGQPSQQTGTPTETCDAKRPVVMFNRWQEDWSVLKNPCVPREPLDSLKYIPLGGDPYSYLSLGANLRERLEINDAPLFGIGSGHSDTYVIQRAQVSADARIGPYLQFFVQLEDARPFGKDMVTPVDKNPLDLEQAFVAWVSPFGPGTVKFRVGRQEMAFDLQRFISVRDGPNVRQAYDAIWADYEYQKWRFIGYLTQPVQYSDVAAFDDTSNSHLTFSGVRFERQGVGPGDLSGYYSLYTRDGARFLDAQGDEHRNVFDLRYTGKIAATDWDVESMYQTGHVGDKTIAAWAVGSLFGYTLNSPWKPRFGVQIDAASGDRHLNDGRVETFNPLFPNGYYFTLAGYTGYANLIHVKPSITLAPSSKLALLFAVGFQWRMSTNDAIYQQGSAVVPGTAGHGTRWTGVYAQMRADWTVAANLIASVEAVHFQVGNSIRELGGSNSDYVGLELKYGW